MWIWNCKQVTAAGIFCVCQFLCATVVRVAWSEGVFLFSFTSVAGCQCVIGPHVSNCVVSLLSCLPLASPVLLSLFLHPTVSQCVNKPVFADLLTELRFYVSLNTKQAISETFFSDNPYGALYWTWHNKSKQRKNKIVWAETENAQNSKPKQIHKNKT